VVTGGPGTGKTVVIRALEAAQFHCFHEIIRDMTAKARLGETKKEQVSNPLAFVDDPFAFNQGLLSGRIAHFKAAEKVGEPICFFDRGIPDVLAYMDYFKQSYGSDFERGCADHAYDIVFMLPPWREIYVSDNERLETFAEAEALHQHLMETYQRFGYRPIMVPKTGIQERMRFILREVKKA